MRKSIILFIAIFASVCSLAVAEEQQDFQQPDRQRPEMQPPDGPREGRLEMMRENKIGKMGPMMGMHPTVVATNDGGVVVLMGGKLIKYDKDLNFVNEVQMKGDKARLKPMEKKAEDREIDRFSKPSEDSPTYQNQATEQTPTVDRTQGEDQNKTANQISPESSSDNPPVEATDAKEQ